MATFNGKKQYTGQEATNISMGQGGWIFADTEGVTHVAVGSKSLIKPLAIASFADGTDGDASDTTVTVTGHSFVNRDTVVIAGSTSYDGVYEVDNVTTDTFDIEKAYTAETAAGDVILNKGNLEAKLTDASTAQGTRCYYSCDFICGVKIFATVDGKTGEDIAEVLPTIADGANCELEPGNTTMTVKLRGGESIFGQFKDIKLVDLTDSTAIIYKG